MVWRALRAGAWLTPARVRAYGAMLCGAYALVFVGLIATSDGMRDLAGRPLGTDFAQVWVAGLNAWAGEAAASFDLAQHHARQNAAFGADIPVYGWHYPPVFLLVAAALALLPYLPALVLYQAVTGYAYLRAIRAIAPMPGAVLLAAAFPAVFVNLGHGHNGFLTAALLGGALHWLDRRPWLAGVLAGLLVYKPQYGLMLGAAMVLGRHWRAIAAAAATVVALVAASTAAFGVASWQAFRDHLVVTRVVVLEEGGAGWEKLQSLFATIRALGGSVEAAYLGHGALIAALLAALAWLWTRPVDARLRHAFVAVATVLATPYALDYDLVALAVALAFLAAYLRDHGLRDWDAVILTLAWAAPGLTRPVALITGVPLGLIGTLLLAALIITKARSGRRYSPHSTYTSNPHLFL